MFRIIVRGVFIVVLVAMAAPAFTQQTEPETPADETTEAAEKAKKEGRVFKDQIVVTPGRQEQASGDAPAPT